MEKLGTESFFSDKKEKKIASPPSDEKKEFPVIHAPARRLSDVASKNIIPEKSKKRPEAIGNVPVSPSPVVQMGIDDDGRVVAGFASFDSLQALYSTETTLRSTLKKLNNSNGAVLDIATRSKNFQV